MWRNQDGHGRICLILYRAHHKDIVQTKYEKANITKHIDKKQFSQNKFYTGILIKQFAQRNIFFSGGSGQFTKKWDGLQSIFTKFWGGRTIEVNLNSSWVLFEFDFAHPTHLETVPSTQALQKYLCCVSYTNLRPSLIPI